MMETERFDILRRRTKAERRREGPKVPGRQMAQGPKPQHFTSRVNNTREQQRLPGSERRAEERSGGGHAVLWAGPGITRGRARRNRRNGATGPRLFRGGKERMTVAPSRTDQGSAGWELTFFTFVFLLFPRIEGMTGERGSEEEEEDR